MKICALHNIQSLQIINDILRIALLIGQLTPFQQQAPHLSSLSLAFPHFLVITHGSGPLSPQIAPKTHNATNNLISATEIDSELLYFTAKFGAALDLFPL